MHGRDTYIITLRYTDVTIKDRLLFDSRVFEVASIEDKEERNRELVLKCVETT